MTKEIQSKEEFDALIQSEQLVLVDFHATWCGPCKMLVPVIDELASESQQNEQLLVVKADVDTVGDVASEVGVRSVPTMVWFRNGEEVHRQVGLITKQQIVDLNNSLKG